jgi:hypothetical protein
MDNAAKEASPTLSSSGLKRVFSRSNRSRTNLNELGSSTTSGRESRPSSIDSSQEKLRPTTSREADLDGAPNVIAKLIPGARRRLRKKNEQEPSTDTETDLRRGRTDGSDGVPMTINGRSRSRPKTDNGNNPLTDDSESDA